jgi:hypothetical protein
VGDWPIKTFLQRHFNNQRAYAIKREKENIAAAESAANMDNLWDFGSNVGGDNQEMEEI